MSTPLLIIPGFLPTESDFDALISALTSVRDTQILMPKVASSAETFEQRVLDWFESLEQDLPEQFYLFGYSMGGRMALALAQWLDQNHPGTMKGLILEGAHPGLTSDVERIARLKNDNEWAQRFRTESMPMVLADWYSQRIFAEACDSMRKHWMQSKSLLNGSDMGEMLLHYSLAHQPDYREFLQTTKVPVYFCAGENDKKIVQLGKNLENINLLLAPSSGHNVHQENPKWLAQFLAELE